jgi:CBS domain-containing protein
MATSNHAKPVRPRFAFRRVQRERSGETTRLAVLCTRRMQVVDVSECRSCEHCRGLCIDPGSRELFLRCVSTAPGEGLEAAPGAGVNAISRIMSSPARCLAESEDLPSALALLVQHDIGAAPVIDARGRPIGILTKTDLLHHCRPQAGDVRLDDDAGAASAEGVVMERRAPPRVREVMSHVVFTLHPDADVSRAAALMAYEGIHHVVVTSQEGLAVGIVSSLDVMRWVARQHGYVVPGAH